MIDEAGTAEQAGIEQQPTQGQKPSQSICRPGLCMLHTHREKREGAARQAGERREQPAWEAQN